MSPRKHNPRMVASRALACALGCMAPVLAFAQVNDPGADPQHDHAAHLQADQTPPAAPADPSMAGHEDHQGHEGHEDHEGHDQAAGADGEDPHAQHRAMMQHKGYQRSEHAYALKDHKLVDMYGRPTGLLDELDDDRPLMVNFIFTTCTTICPVMSGVFAQVQKELGPESDQVRMISVSIDPQYDNPQRLRDYARRFDAGPQWQFLTGDPDDIIAVQKAFDVYRGNKMSHEPTTLLRGSPDRPWVRLDGIASAAEIVAEYRQLADD